MINPQSNDEDIIEFLKSVAQQHAKDPRLAAEFAVVLANSGSKFVRKRALTADVASTGGPASLSTLLCPLFLRVAGLEVPKLGVPGRPAGGIDCLAQIPGYKTSLTDSELEAVMDEAGYAHFLTSGRYAPFDARVFKLRQQNRFQDIPTLVVASLLSKKLAVGVATAGLDIRVAPHGNFGQTMAEAKENAELFVQAAELLGVVGRPLLTDGSVPYQPYIGRSEALAALADVFMGAANAWLQGHVETCRRLSLAVVPAERVPLVETATGEDLYRAFKANVVAQGASEAGFEDAVLKSRCGTHLEVHAGSSGEVSVSLEGIRRLLVQAQSAAAVEGGTEFPDPVGIVLQRSPGDAVVKGDVLATVRIDDESIRNSLLVELSAMICVTEQPGAAAT